MMTFSLQQKNIRIALHLVFWVISYFILLRLFSFQETPEKVDHIYTLLFHLFLIPAVYINLYILIPGTDQSKRNPPRWSIYIGSSLILILLFSWLNTRFFNTWSAGILPDYYFISYYSLWEVARILFIYLSVSTLLKLSKSWFLVNELKQQLLQTEKEKADIELMALKSQINPHFFFNTLNGLYAMSLKKDNNLPTSILQLSGLMRYFIYESKSDHVPLEKEIAVLEDYIGLMKIRADENANIIFEKQGEPENLYIAPLLLISFLENAFKHGLKGTSGYSFLRMKLSMKPEKLIFSISNNKGRVDDSLKEQSGGIGLENVKRRLALLYPGKHDLSINDTGSEFNVTLQLQLND